MHNGLTCAALKSQTHYTASTALRISSFTVPAISVNSALRARQKRRGVLCREN